MHTLFLAYANDTVCQYAFDYSMRLLEEPQKAQEWMTTIASVASLTPLIKQFTWLIPTVKMVPPAILRKTVPRLYRILSLQTVSRKSHYTIVDFFDDATKPRNEIGLQYILLTPEQRMEEEASKAIQNYVESRKSNEMLEEVVESKSEPSANILHHILESNLPAEEKMTRRMGEEAFTVIAAGGETVARTLTTAAYHLVANPSMLQKLRAELREVQPDPREHTELQQLEQLPYLVSEPSG